MKSVVVIPARYGSTRFPGKVLVPLRGKPMLYWVYEGARRSRLVERVIIATDDERVFQAAAAFCDDVIMTSPDHRSGTDRIAEAIRDLDYDIIINVQGDEPLIKAQMIDDLAELMQDDRAAMGTLVKRICEAEDIFNPNVVKVVTDEEGFALYFSRAPIPFHRELFIARDAGGSYELAVPAEELGMYKHIGIYGYRKEVLLSLASMPDSTLEAVEKLEQLRALEKGIRIKVKETPYDTIGVDTAGDLEKVEAWLNTFF